ncbi:MAG: ABC transporter ATP-binding protein [Candidatus Moraniibacteriota bacterium]
MEQINKKTAVKIENIKKSFHVGESDIPVLFGIDTEIYEGEFVMLVGPSGCGKSTLLHTIYGLEQPTEGEIYIDGEGIWSHTKNWRAHFRNEKVGFIPQQTFWIKSLSVIENMAIPEVIAGGSFHSGIEKAAKLIELVGMEKFADYRPYDLSGGQQQRIALARSLLLNPRFIIADEPTGNLDQKAGDTLLTLLQEINRKFNITILMVTHDQSQYKFASRIIKMVDGKIISDELNAHSFDNIAKTEIEKII